MPLPLFEQPMASTLKVVPGNRADAVAHVTGSGVLPHILGTANKVYVDQPQNMSDPILAHEVMHKIQQTAGSFKPGEDNYNYGGLEGLKKLGSVGKLNSEQQAEIPADYLGQMQEFAKRSITPQDLQNADQMNSAFARPIQQLAAMARPGNTIDTTPAAPGPPPAALTGMIKPLPEIGGKTLYK